MISDRMGRVAHLKTFRHLGFEEPAKAYI